MTDKEKDAPLLVAQKGSLKGERWYLNRSLLIGRGGDCDVLIADRRVSRYHARMRLTEEGVVLEDMGSKNGTFHNGVLITSPVILRDGDLVQIALAQEFIFLLSDATMPLDAEMMRPRRLQMDERSRTVWINQQELEPPLSANQFQLLWILYRRSGQVVPRRDLVRAVWGDEALGVSEQALDALVRRLRDRLAEIDPTHEYIVTVRGHGLQLAL